jgi:hypothetical protein
MFERFRVALLSLVAVPVGIAGLSATAEAGTITLHRDDTKYTADIGGGEFGATAFSGADIPTAPMRMNNFSGVTNTIFQTFCVEGGTHVSLDQTLNWTLSGNINGNGATPLHDKTAYLFTQFWNGNLYSGAEGQLGSTRIANAKDLQEAIWFIEGQWQGTFSTLTAGAQSLYNQATTAVAQGGAWFGKGLGDVRVLVLTDSSGAAMQDVLILLSVPLPPAALLGLGLIGGLGVVGLVRRRRQSIVS